MLRHSNFRAIAAIALLALGTLGGCGVKGPLVPAPSAKSETPLPATPPPIPSATIPGNPERKP